jgi:hypothetical protein
MKDGGVNEYGLSTYKISSRITINGSVPNLRVVEGADGNVDSLKFKDIKTIREGKDILLNTKNMGLGLDLGMNYKLTDKWSVSASILDLGYIRWKDNLHNFRQDTSYDFQGVYVQLNDSTDKGSALLDTLKDHFTYTNSQKPYTTTLSPKLYAGILFQPCKLLGLGFLTRQQIIEKKLYSQYTFSLNLYPANFFNLTLSYTIADQVYDNFGVGLSFKPGPFQFYVLSERLPLFWDKNHGKGIPVIPAYEKNVNIRFGVNLVFGYNHRFKKLNKDKPLVE